MRFIGAVLLGLFIGWWLGLRQGCPGSEANPWDVLKARALDAAGDLYCRSRG